jgi:hypothetical protein
MLRSMASLVLLCPLLVACGDDDDGGSGSTTTSTTTTLTSTGETEPGTSTTDPGTSTTDPDTSGTTTDTTGPGTSDTTGDPSSDGSTGTVSCESYAAGDWAPCRDGEGFDLTQCNWSPDTGEGTLSCLTTNADPQASVCMIEGCVDVCDCFAPPSTGNATVLCGPLNATTNACALGCGQGQTCPDDMECIQGVCYHVP